MSSQKMYRGRQAKRNLDTTEMQLMLIPEVLPEEKTSETQLGKIAKMASSGKPLKTHADLFKRKKLYVDLSVIASIQDALTSGGLELNENLPFGDESKIARLSSTNIESELTIEIMKNYYHV